MRLGLVLECGPDGADKKVCGFLIKTFFANIQLGEIITLGNKPNLIAECGDTAHQLLQSGHDRVFIIWDLYPAWREKKQNPCRKEDRQMILNGIHEKCKSSEKVFLICISEELEAWLLADGRALSAFLSTPAHPVVVKDHKNPERVNNPKKVLNKLMTENGYRKYTDYLHAVRIIQLLPDLNKLRRIPSFMRFCEKLELE